MPRGATTYLFEVLKLHPKIFMPSLKELNYFANNYGEDEKLYQAHFENSALGQVYFDVSPIYFLHDIIFERIKIFNPNQKIILILREPNQWLYSMYRQYLSYTVKPLSFEGRMTKWPVDLGDNIVYLDLTKIDFINKLKNIKKLFQGNLMLIKFDDFRNNKVRILTGIEEFIGVDHFFDETNIIAEKINAGNKPALTKMTSKLIAPIIMNRVVPSAILRYIPGKILNALRVFFLYGRTTSGGDTNSDVLRISYYDPTVFGDIFNGNSYIYC